jgi:hypothetical protein
MEDAVPEARREAAYELALFRLHAAHIDETPVALIKTERLLSGDVTAAPVPAEAFEVLVRVEFDELLVEETPQSLGKAWLADGSAPAIRIAHGKLQRNVSYAQATFPLALGTLREPHLLAARVRARRGTAGSFSLALHRTERKV